MRKRRTGWMEKRDSTIQPILYPALSELWRLLWCLIITSHLERSATELELSWNVHPLDGRVDEMWVGEVQRVLTHAHKRRPVISKHTPDVQDRQGNHTRPSWEVRIHISEWMKSLRPSYKSRDWRNGRERFKSVLFPKTQTAKMNQWQPRVWCWVKIGWVQSVLWRASEMLEWTNLITAFDSTHSATENKIELDVISL